jgi:predicted MFS family arabinose efflux permease
MSATTPQADRVPASVPALLMASRGPMAAFVAMGCVWGAFMATLPDLKAGLGASDGQMGVILVFGSVAAISQMLLSPRIAGWLGRGALPLGLLAMAGAISLPAGAGTAVAFAGAMLAMGASSGATDVWMNARLADIEADRRMALMNLNHAIYAFAYGGAALAAGAARAAGLAPGAILGATALLVVVLALMAHERDGRLQGMGGGGGAAVPLGPVPWLAGGLVLVSFLSESATESWSALYIERDLGAATGVGSAGPAVLGICMGVGRLIGQALALRVADRVMLRGGLVMAACGAGLAAAAPGPGVALAGFAVLGLGAAVGVPVALALTGRLSAPGTRGRAIARATVVGYLGFFLGPPGMGLVAELVGLRASYGLIALALLGALVLAARLMRQDP